MSYKVLVVDDEQVRLDAFQKRFQDVVELSKEEVDYHQAMSAPEAIEVLKKEGPQTFDCICLDHDLSDLSNKIYTFGKGTGTEIAQYLADSYDGWKLHENTTIIIHSGNTWGAVNMANVLSSSGFVEVMIRPFLWTKEVFDATFCFLEGEDEE